MLSPKLGNLFLKNRNKFLPNNLNFCVMLGTGRTDGVRGLDKVVGVGV